jgi:hypothetical protein
MILTLLLGHSILPVFNRFVCIAVPMVSFKTYSRISNYQYNLRGAGCCAGVMGIGSGDSHISIVVPMVKLCSHTVISHCHPPGYQLLSSMPRLAHFIVLSLSRLSWICSLRLVFDLPSHPWLCTRSTLWFVGAMGVKYRYLQVVRFNVEILHFHSKLPVFNTHTSICCNMNLELRANNLSQRYRKKQKWYCEFVNWLVLAVLRTNKKAPKHPCVCNVAHTYGCLMMNERSQTFMHLRVTICNKIWTFWRPSLGGKKQ